MKQIPIRPELAPRSLNKARLSGLDWSEYSVSEEGHALRRAKCEEQNGLCGYCECRLTSADGSLPAGVSHIDHFYPKYKGKDCRPELAFVWENMVLSCMQESSCGRHKDRQSIPPDELLNPHVDNPRDFITFIYHCEDGLELMRAHPVPGLDDDSRKKALRTIEAFQLNTVSLEQRRMNTVQQYRGWVDDVASLLKDRELAEWAEAEKAVLLSELESQPFCSALVAYAEAQMLS